MRTRYLMKVLPYDSLTRVHVTSQTDPSREPYLVDLLEYNRNGYCSCMGFAVNHQKALEAMPPGFCDWEGDIHRCKHIKLVRAVLGLQLLESLLEIEHDKEKTKTKESPMDDDQGAFDRSQEVTQAPPSAQQVNGETDEGIPKAEGTILGGTQELHGVRASAKTEQCRS